MRTFVPVLLLITIGVWITLQVISSRTNDVDIKARFIERIDYIPSSIPLSAPLTADNFQRWLTDPSKRSVRARYASPVLFPLDYAFLFALGLLLGTASLAISARLPFSGKIPGWIWLIFPAAYVVSDFLEDSVLIALFTSKLDLSEYVYRSLRLLTTVKIATVSIALYQTGFLFALWCLLRLYPSDR